MRSPVRSSRPRNHRSRRFISRQVLLTVAAVFVFVNHSSAAGGDIDPTFNAGGDGADDLIHQRVAIHK